MGALGQPLTSLRSCFERGLRGSGDFNKIKISIFKEVPVILEELSGDFCEAKCLRLFHATADVGSEFYCHSLGFTKEQLKMMTLMKRCFQTRQAVMNYKSSITIWRVQDWQVAHDHHTIILIGFPETERLWSDQFKLY